MKTSAHAKKLATLLVLALILLSCSKALKSLEPDARDTFVGGWTWAATITYPSNTQVFYNDSVVLTKSSAANGLSVKFHSGVVLAATLKDSLITISSQVVDGATLAGTIILANDGTMQFNFTSTSGSLHATFKGDAGRTAGVSVTLPRDAFLGPWTGPLTSTTCVGASAVSLVIQPYSSANVTLSLTGGGLVYGSITKGTLGFGTESSVSAIQVSGGQATLTGSVITLNQILTMTYSVTSTSIFSNPPITTTCGFKIVAKRY